MRNLLILFVFFVSTLSYSQIILHDEKGNSYFFSSEKEVENKKILNTENQCTLELSEGDDKGAIVEEANETNTVTIAGITMSSEVFGAIIL